MGPYHYALIPVFIAAAWQLTDCTMAIYLAGLRGGLDELRETARVDGANFMGVYWRVMFPLSLPGFVVVIIWQFTNIWNEFLFAVTILQKP